MALALVLVFFVVAFVGRVIIQYRNTGDHGIRSAFASPSLLAQFSSLMIVAVFISWFIIAIWLEPQIDLGRWAMLLGCVISVAGILLTCISQLQMGTSWRIGVDESERIELITSGIYSSIRNPIYTGVLLFTAGLVLLVPHLLTIIVLLVAYIAIELHVRKVEEPYLASLHGELFTEYLHKTGRYLPRFSPLN